MTLPNRSHNPTSCKVCGMNNLQWLNTESGWRLVPFGTDDLSGKVHALTPRDCAAQPRTVTYRDGEYRMPSGHPIEARAVNTIVALANLYR